MPRYSTRPRPDQGRSERNWRMHTDRSCIREAHQVRDYSQMRIIETVEELMNVYAIALDEFQREEGMTQSSTGERGQGLESGTSGTQRSRIVPDVHCAGGVGPAAEHAHGAGSQDDDVHRTNQLTALSRLPYERKVNPLEIPAIRAHGGQTTPTPASAKDHRGAGRRNAMLSTTEKRR